MTPSFPASVISVALVAISPSGVQAQTSSPGQLRPSVREARAVPLLWQERPELRGGAEFGLPAASLVLPGLGQYVLGRPWRGAAFTATAVAGGILAGTASAPIDDFPRDSDQQLAFEGAHLIFTAGALSAWDSFQASLPEQRRAGRYTFMGPQDGLQDLLTAPFDFGFLGRWTTWVDLAFTGAVEGLVMADDDEAPFRSFRGNDAAFISSLSLNAAVGEEALFRGWLMPVLHQKLGRRFWAANTIQAVVFGAGHVPQADRFAILIGASAAYAGWLTQRNGWSVRETIFHHFWYDLIVGAATLLRDPQGTAVAFPTVRITF